MTDWKTVDPATLAAGERADWVIEEARDPLRVAQLKISIYAPPPIPAYTTSVDAALGLLPYDRYNPWIHWGYFEGIGEAVECKLGPYFAHAETPALAICRAWLAWRQAQEESE